MTMNHSGYICDSRKSRISHRISFHGFTLIELLVVIAVISLLVSILLPSLTKARDFAKLVSCQANLKAFGIAYMTYANDSNDWLPSYGHQNYEEAKAGKPASQYPYKRFWKVALAPHLDIGEVPKNKDSMLFQDLWNGRKYTIFICPGATEDRRTVYGEKLSTNYHHHPFWNFPAPNSFICADWPILHANLAWFKDTSGAMLNWCWYGRLDNHNMGTYLNTHEFGRNILYVDGHVGTLNLEQDDPAFGRPIDELLRKY